jgi:pimeloyl-ACP methyl ester carboxylesterase
MHFVRTGAGTPLLLLHGIGGTHRSWDPIAPSLADERELIAVDLPGHGQTAPLPVTTIATYADALEQFIAEHELGGVDVVGASMGARLALELARRGSVGNVVALDPGGFWTRTEQRIFGTSVRLSVMLLKVLRPVLPWLTGNPVTRTLLLGQFSGRPWALEGSVVLPELLSFLDTVSFAEALDALANGPMQEGAATVPARVVVGWGKRDLVTLPRQSRRLQALFPMAEIEMYDRCGHFPYWDAPDRAVATILRATRRTDTPLPT